MHSGAPEHTLAGAARGRAAAAGARPGAQAGACKEGVVLGRESESRRASWPCPQPSGVRWRLLFCVGNPTAERVGHCKAAVSKPHSTTLDHPACHPAKRREGEKDPTEASPQCPTKPSHNEYGPRSVCCQQRAQQINLPPTPAHETHFGWGWRRAGRCRKGWAGRRAARC